MSVDETTIRPTPCNKKIYLGFVSKVREIGREIGQVENDLFSAYTKLGEDLFRRI
jgi:hypothetical protein